MSRFQSAAMGAALGAALLASALAGTACGRYGPPLRAHETAAAQDENPPPEPITDPTVDPGDPVVPDPEEP